MCHVTRNMWHMTYAMWQVEGGEHSLKIWSLLLIWLGREGVLKIFVKKIDLICDEGVYRTAPRLHPVC